MTERTRMRFVVKQSANEKPFIACEPLVENLSVLDRGFLSLDLKAGTSFEEAESIARFLDEKLVGIAYTVVPGLGREALTRIAAAPRSPAVGGGGAIDSAYPTISAGAYGFVARTFSSLSRRMKSAQR